MPVRMSDKKRKRKGESAYDDAFVDYPRPSVKDLITGPDPDEEEDFLEGLDAEVKMPVRWFIYLAIAIFCAGLAVNVCQMGIDYAVTAYQSEKFLRWQDDQIKQYEHEHPGSHPSTKDYPSDL